MYINVYMYICKHVYIYSKGGVATVVHRHKVCRRWEGNESIVLRNLKKGLTPAQPETTTQSDCDDECRGVNLIYIHIYIHINIYLYYEQALVLLRLKKSSTRRYVDQMAVIIEGG